MWHVMYKNCGSHRGGNRTVVEAVATAIIRIKRGSTGSREKEEKEEEEKRREEEEREGSVQRRGAGIVIPPVEVVISIASSPLPPELNINLLVPAPEDATVNSPPAASTVTLGLDS